VESRYCNVQESWNSDRIYIQCARLPGHTDRDLSAQRASLPVGEEPTAFVLVLVMKCGIFFYYYDNYVSDQIWKSLLHNGITSNLKG
jgi:hypothetical protein